jgi:hypothetical protein
MSNVFDDARRDADRQLSEERAQKEAAARKESDEQRRKQEDLKSARQRLAGLYAHVPDLHSLLIRTGLPPSHAEGEWRRSLRSPIYQTVIELKGGRHAWPLADVPLLGRRRIQTGGNSKTGNTSSWLDIPIGLHGIALLEDGQVFEFRSDAESLFISIDHHIDLTSAAPPKFAFDMAVEPDWRGYYSADEKRRHERRDADEREIFVSKKWSHELELAMTKLASACYQREGRTTE